MTRFKGLGEISPGEFKDFIGDGIRLEPVILNEDTNIDDVLQYYMAKTPPPVRNSSLTPAGGKDDAEEALEKAEAELEEEAVQQNRNKNCRIDNSAPGASVCRFLE